MRTKGTADNSFEEKKRIRRRRRKKVPHSGDYFMEIERFGGSRSHSLLLSGEYVTNGERKRRENINSHSQ